MRVFTTYQRTTPSHAKGHELVLTQVFYSADKAEIDLVEETFKSKYDMGGIVKYDVSKFTKTNGGDV